MKKALFLSIITLIGIVVGTAEVWAQDAAPAVADEGSGWVDIALYLSYAMVILAAAGAIILPTINAAGDPKSLLRSGLGVVVILAVFLVGYLLSGNEVRPIYEQFNVDSGDSKMIGGGLIASYLLIFAALAGIVYTELSTVFK
jgi:NADH:ubiquinone oxidoreductase subunit 6 (subunit J)